MYNIKNHRLEWKIISDSAGLWATNGYLFCYNYIAEYCKILYYKDAGTNGAAGNIDNKVNELINTCNLISVKARTFTGDVMDERTINLLWEVVDDNGMKHYFDSKLIGWLLYRLNKLDYKPITYKIDPEKKVLLFEFDGDIVGGVIGLNMTEEDLS